MQIGFTGTRDGMSDLQVNQLRRVMLWLSRGTDRIEFTGAHHGECEGADLQFDDFVKTRFPHIKVVPHPANGNPLKRDKEIVGIVDVLIAAPRTDKEVLRSGTWATVRYAREKGIPVIMLSRGK